MTTLVRCLEKRIAKKLGRVDSYDIWRDPKLAGHVELTPDIVGRARDAAVFLLDVIRDPDCCFLTPPWPQKIGPDDILDISHESLIRHWDRLRAWVADEAASADLACEPSTRASREGCNHGSSPDGKTVAVGDSVRLPSGDGGSVARWDVNLDSWKDIAGQIANRNLTRPEWRQYFPDQPYHATFPDQ